MYSEHVASPHLPRQTRWPYSADVRLRNRVARKRNDRGLALPCPWPTARPVRLRNLLDCQTPDPQKDRALPLRKEISLALLFFHFLFAFAHPLLSLLRLNLHFNRCRYPPSPNFHPSSFVIHKHCRSLLILATFTQSDSAASILISATASVTDRAAFILSTSPLSLPSRPPTLAQ